MQRAMHQQVRVVGLQRLFIFSGFFGHHRRAQHQVGSDDGLLGVVESQDIGGVVFLPVVVVERPAFFKADDTHRDFCVIGQRMANPARHALAWQGGAVQGFVNVCKIAKLQR